MFLRFRKWVIAAFIIMALVSAYYSSQLKFSFSFDQFFPKGDPDLEFYKKFVKDFESDDNFLLIAIENKPTVFDSTFLARFHAFGLVIRNLKNIKNVQSLTQLKVPIKTPFGFSTIPLIHMDDPEQYNSDKQNILSDERFVFNLIDTAASSLVIAAKTIDNIGLSDSRQLMDKIDSLLLSQGLREKSHVLGRSYFQRELVDFQKKELILAFISSLILVTIVMVILYRKPIGIIISLGSIALGLLLFMGYLGASGSELNAISALFPVIMLIVGSSDVIHIFSKYVDELKKGKEGTDAMKITIKEIGMATFMTSFTTAIGFATLTTSKLQTIQSFGINAAIGVMIAYVTVLFFTTSVLSIFNRDRIIRESREQSKWNWILDTIYNINIYRSKLIFLIIGVLIVIFFIGMSKISTNYNLEDNLPIGSRVAQDFKFFETNYAGFRPLEFAVFANNSLKADEYKVVKEVDKLERKIKASGNIKATFSVATLYRSLNKMNHGNADSAYIFPENEESFYNLKKLIDKSGKSQSLVLVSKEKDKTRISGKITDIGADKIKKLGSDLDQWVKTNIDSTIITVKRTGTGLILDKNSEYITINLFQGLGFSILIISILMGLLFRSLRMLIIALIPNLIPLLFAGAILGYFSIELEAGVAIMFTIIFGIAVDDTIHFLTRYKICIAEGLDNKDAIKKTINETGKAIIFTSIILFFGFLNMIFSTNPPTFTVGILISVTLLSALLCDLFLLPALIHNYMK